MAAQSHRSKGLRRPYDGGTAGIQSTHPRGLPRSLLATNRLVMGTREYMTSSGKKHVRLGNSIGILLFALAMSLLSAVPAQAQSAGGCVANFGGVIDGFVNPIPPSQLNIDGNCTIRNFPVSNPFTSNISFSGTGTGWLVIFNNVDFIGNISCDKSHGNFLWFVNGSITTVRASCQNLFIPVEKIDKENPAGQTTAAIGVPFTYSLTIPVMFDPGSGIVINNQGSPNDLHSI